VVEKGERAGGEGRRETALYCELESLMDTSWNDPVEGKRGQGIDRADSFTGIPEETFKSWGLVIKL